MKPKILIFLLTTTTVLFVSTYFLIPTKNIKPQILNAQKTVENVPFIELTIPYLKSKTYQSNLGKLEKIKDTASYSSYLTSYTSDNFNINGLLTIPSGKKPDKGWPAIVFVHGYIPPTIYKTQEKYVSYVDYLAKNGFVVFKIDLRGHGNSQGEANGSYYSSDYVIDTLNAYSALENSDLVDPKNISLWGHSMAGNIIFRSFVINPKIQKIVVWAGAGYTYNDLIEYRLNDNSYRPPTSNSQSSNRRRQLFEAHGTFDPNNDFWKQVTPINYLEGKTGSIQLHHATDDNVVNIEYSRNLIKFLKNTDIQHQLFEYTSGGHNITGANFTKAMERTIDFLKK